MNRKPDKLRFGKTTARLFLVLTALLCLPNSRAALLLEDQFIGYGSGDLGTDATTGTLNGWQLPTGEITLTNGSGSLNGTNLGLFVSDGDRVFISATDGACRNQFVPGGTFPQSTLTNIYYSWLHKFNDAADVEPGGELISRVTRANSGVNNDHHWNLLARNVAGQIQLGLSKAGGTTTNYAARMVNAGETIFIVIRQTIIPGEGNDVYALWVNPAPASFGADEGTSPAPGASIGQGAEDQSSTGPGRYVIWSGANAEYDEVRIATTWAEVTPSGGPVPQQQPYITEGYLSPEGFVLRGTNGTPSGVYQVLRSTDILSPANLWPAIATNAFDISGNFETTNPIPTGAQQNFYRLLLGGEIPAAPTITNQPSDLAVLVGANAQFSVTAVGTEPLSYQWYFDDEAISGATESSHTVAGAQTNDAGGYHVVVTNSIGSVTSVVATLTVVPAPEAGVPDGYATLGNGTTGGAGGPTVTVSTFEDFDFYVDNNTGPYVILVSGTINLGGSNVRVRDNKTIIGLGPDATLVGDLKVDGNNNVIIRNITFTNPSGVGDGDGLTLQDCENVWVDHCTFVDCDDGSLDISHGADWITVSWCHFYYTNPSADHRFANLVGHSDSSSAEAEDTGKFHVTYHHNWWGQLVHERMPRVRFGRVHVFNNYYNSPGNNNCIRAARDSEILVENNYFDSVKNVWELYRTVGLDGKVFASGNFETNTTWSAGSDSNSIQIPGTDVLSSEANGLNPPPYAYTLDPALDIPAAVTNNAGAGRGPFAP